jgi:hypothetical protein
MTTHCAGRVYDWLMSDAATAISRRVVTAVSSFVVTSVSTAMFLMGFVRPRAVVIVSVAIAARRLGLAPEQASTIDF